MMPDSGHWLGKGTLLAAGRSLGSSIECTVRIEQEEGAATVSGSLQEEGEAAVEFSIRAARNEEGTWTLGVLSGSLRLQGTAKLDSPPNLAMLWNDAGNLYLAVANFAIAGGYGCRGFLRDGGRVRTWEIALRLKQEVLRGPNVVSLRRRHKPD